MENIGWEDLRKECAESFKEVSLSFSERDFARAELAAYALLELLRMAKRWSANGNRPPDDLAGLLED